ncbi:hypothetical protein [Tomitella biformata]|uniref:hypothetical protein n=1 Tax=Tomitella biformata TaxID=630403 RepID=UPI0004649749|nr:hypothetical protein [Tomitella biformata]
MTFIIPPSGDPHPLSIEGLLATSMPIANSEPALPTRVTRRNLAAAITDALCENKEYDLEAECCRLGMAAKVEDEDDPYTSKRAYVNRRTTAMDLSAMVDLARKITADYDAPPLSHLLSLAGIRGVDGEMKNLIFAADGPKPEIVLDDALNNVIRITKNEEYCLVFDQPLSEHGLTWRDLTRWWAGSDTLDAKTERTKALELYDRLMSSMNGNGAEQLMFKTYCSLYGSHGFNVPALIPQVYLHYDPYTKGAGATLPRQRMDFLLLLPGNRRIVLELDGMQHYASTDRQASPTLYAQMMVEDRKLRLAGYEVFRFGGAEFTNHDAAPQMLLSFFRDLLELPEN